MSCVLERREKTLPPHRHAQPPTIRSFCERRRRKCIETSMHWKLQWVLLIWVMMVNVYSISCKMQKWPKNLFFHPAGLTIQNTFIIHESCAQNHTHKLFQAQFEWGLIPFMTCPPPAVELQEFTSLTWQDVIYSPQGKTSFVILLL
jgi:hypothetical protein